MKTATNTVLLKIAIGLGVSSALFAQVPTYTVSTLVGNYSLTDTSDNSPVTSPYAVTVDANGNVYYTDTIGNRVRRVDATTGAVTTVAGSGSLGGGANTIGAGTVSNATEPTTILGGGVATKVALWQPTGLVFDAAGNLYISDGFNQTVDKVDVNGVLTIFAGTVTDSGWNGDGFAANVARIRNPQRLATDAAGNIYIADKENNRIRKVTTDGIIHTVAGVGGNGTTTGHAYSGDGGPAVEAGIGQPEAVAVDSFGNIYLTDNTNNRVRMVQVTGPTGVPLTNSSGQPLTDTTRTITTVVGGLSTSQAGTTTAKGIEGAGTANQTNTNPLNNILSSPAGLAIDASNNVYIADRGNNRILYLNNNYSSCSAGSTSTCSATPTLTLVASSVTSGGLCVQLCSPSGIYLSGTKLYIAETGINRISVIDVVANTYSIVDQTETSPLNAPRGLAINPTTNAVYVADTANQRISTIPAAGGSMAVIAGITGNAGFPTAGGDENAFNPVKASTSLVNTPWGGAFDLNGNYYFADKGNNRVRMINAAGVITTIAGGLATPVPSIVQSKGVATASVAAGYGGDGLPAVEGQLKSPSAVAVDNVGGTNACPTAPCVYIADTGNNTIRQVSAGGVMTTFAGMAPQCAAALINGTAVCAGLGAGAYGDGQLAVQPFDPSEVTTTTTYGPGGTVTSTSTIADISNLNTPEGVAVDSSGNVYIADTLNHSIRVVNSTTLIITTLIGDELAESAHAADGLIGINTFNDSPVAVAVGPDGSVYYAEGCVAPATATTGINTFGQCENSRIRRWDVKTGLVTTISAGNNAASLEAASYADGVKSTAALALVPTAVAVDSTGNVYFADATNRVRKFTCTSCAAPTGH